jgi:hypothetical protein
MSAPLAARYRPAVREEDFVVIGEGSKLFIVTGVEEATDFKPKARKEISKVQFFAFDQVPMPTWDIEDILPKLRRWIKQHKCQGRVASASRAANVPAAGPMQFSRGGGIGRAQGDAPLTDTAGLLLSGAPPDPLPALGSTAILASNWTPSAAAAWEDRRGALLTEVVAGGTGGEASAGMGGERPPSSFHSGSPKSVAGEVPTEASMDHRGPEPLGRPPQGASRPPRPPPLGSRPASQQAFPPTCSAAPYAAAASARSATPSGAAPSKPTSKPFAFDSDDLVAAMATMLC